MKRKLFCLCLILGILMSFSMTVSAKSFDDTDGHWAEEAIDEWSDNGILNGIGNNKFNPDGLMTRAEAAAVFSRLLALNERTSLLDFKDVDSDAWYADSLEKCVAAGILNGDGSNMNPNGYITREMFFTMFGRAFNIQPESTLTKEFSDADEISSWAQGYTYAFINQGYVNGVTKDTVAPKQNIDRASVITLLDRLIANYAVQDNDVLQSTDKGISLVIANNCTVADGFSGTVVISGDDTKISFKGASVNTKIIVKADNAVITDAPEGVTISVVKGAENVEVNGKQVEEDTTFTVTVEKVEEKEDKKPVIVGGGGHSHRYTGSETTKATCTEDGVMTYTCRCGRSYTKAIPKLSENGEHTPAEPVKENETETTYDEVVYCSVCTVEISRTQKSNVSCAEHTPATEVKENEVAGTCKVEGTYDEVVYCSVCDDEISRTQKTSGYGEHVPAEAIKENEVVGNCQTHATYDEVVYCSVCRTHEIGRIQKTGELGDHTPGTPVRENEIAGTCVVEGTYDEVVYCSVCGTHEISRTQKTSGYGEHIPATAVKENEVAGTCLIEGTYDEVVYCSVCNTHEISRTQKTSGYGEHIPAQAVRENEVAGTCKVQGAYDEVVYCSVCGTHEISRIQKTSGYGNHTPETAIRENEVAGNCETEGTYDEVVYCSVCDDEISRTQKASGYGDHSPAEAVKENIVASSCDSAGTYDEVIYCSICGDELSREEKTTAVIGHTPSAPVRENEVAGTCLVEGTYDEVIYCSVCNTYEISRTQRTSGYGEHIPAQAIRENEVAGTCLVEGTYDEVVYCSVCSTHEISRTPKTSGYGEHIPATAVKENEVAGNCQTPATYDEVVYCSVCGTHEISRIQKTGELGNHTPSTPVKENEVAGTCKDEGTYDEVVYCSVCSTHEISRTQKTTGYGDHKFAGGNCEYCGEAETQDTPEFIVDSVTASAGDTIDVVLSVKNNPGIFDMILSFTYDNTAMTLTKTTNGDVLSDATFMAPKNMASGCRATWYYMDEPDEYADGSVVTLTFDILDTAAAGDYAVTVAYDNYDINNYDGDPLSFKITSGTVKIGSSSHVHTPANAVKENEVPGTCKVKATYDEVVYCSECGDEISRTQKTGDYGAHKYVSGNCEYCGEAEESNEPQFIVSSTTASAGDSVQVIVSLKNNPAIFDMILSFTYDSNAMALKSVTNGEVMSDATFMAPKNMASGCRATWYYMDEPAEYIDGSVVVLTFDILNTTAAGEYGVSVSYDNYDINNYDGDPLSFVITDGVVTVE